MKIPSISSGILCAFALVLPGCSSPFSASLDIAEQARILLGYSIDGIKIGDSKDEVTEKLGEPDEIGRGDFPGVILAYTQGTHAGLSVMIYTETGQGVRVINAGVLYTGKTTSGIGIGSTREQVLELIGKPDSAYTDSAGNLADQFRYREVFINVEYLGTEVESIFMGTKAL